MTTKEPFVHELVIGLSAAEYKGFENQSEKANNGTKVFGRWISVSKIVGRP
jgi:hypothetical protein